MCRPFPEEAVPSPVLPWAPSLAHMGGHSPGAALPCAWGQLSPNFLRAGGRRKGHFNQPLWFSAMNKHSGLPRKGNFPSNSRSSNSPKWAAVPSAPIHALPVLSAGKTDPFQRQEMSGWRGGTAPGADRTGQRSATWATVPERRLCHSLGWKYWGKTNSKAIVSKSQHHVGILISRICISHKQIWEETWKIF